MNYLPKSNGKDNGLKSRLCLSCKNGEMSLKSFQHNTVDMCVSTVMRRTRVTKSGGSTMQQAPKSQKVEIRAPRAIRS